MNHTRKYQSIVELLHGSEFGFVVFHQEPALGNDYRDTEKEYDEVTEKLLLRTGEATSQLRELLGTPSIESAEWDLGIPTWASGGGYALWTREEDFVSSFISWDNPEDPAFVIVGRAAADDFSADHLNPKPDPWEASWMSHGEW